MVRLMMKAHQLLRTERERRIRLAVLVAELNLEHVRRKQLDNCADLSADQPRFGISSSKATVESKPTSDIAVPHFNST